MKTMRYAFLLTLLLPLGVSAQLMSISGPKIDTIPCTQPCRTINSNYFETKKTSSYQASSISFAPQSLTTPSNLTLQDDKFSGAVPIGFTFCFYENTYTNVYISANGHITFNSTYGSGNCSFDTKQGLPFYNATYPDNAIFCPFTDGNTTIGGTIKYQTIGTAPFRKFVIQYSNIPFFGTNCNGSPSTFQCVLSETSNEIDFFIKNKSTCNTDPANWLNYSTLGIQNVGSIKFTIINNRNASIWSASNEGWKLKPSGALGYNMKWFVNGVLTNQNVNTITVCDPFRKLVVAEYSLDCPAVTIRDSVTIYKIKPTIDSVSTTPSACKNIPSGTASVLVSGGASPYTYSINGSPFGSSPSFTNLSYGSNTITVKDASGCTESITFSVGVTSTLAAVIDSVKKPFCPLQNGSLYGSGSGGVAPYTFRWNTNSTNSSIHNLGAGTYSLIVTDAVGCKDTVVYPLDIDGLPALSAVLTKAVCGDSTGGIDLSVSGGTPPYNYVWSTMAITQDLTNSPSGNYSVTVTDSNGCQNNTSYNVLDTLNMGVGINNIIHTTCGLNNGAAQVNAFNGLPPYSYQWSNSTANALANNLSSGWAIVTVVDANFCTRKDSALINASAGMQINFVYKNPFCDEDNGLITAAVIGNIGSVNFLWNNGDTTATTDSLPAGNHIINITDSIGCTFSKTLNLVNEGKPKITVLQYIKALCKGDSTGRLLLGGTGGTAPYKYSFDGINFSAIALQTNFSAGTFKIYIRDANSCLSDTTITFQEQDAILAQHAAIDTLICYDDKTGAVTLTAKGGVAPYLWSKNGIDYQSQNTLSGFSVGANTIYIKDSNNCVSKQEIIVPGPPARLAINADVEDVPCYQEIGGSITASFEGGWNPYSYSWGHTSDLNLTLDNLIPGRFNLTLTDNKGCVVDSSISVQQKYCCDCYFPNAFTPNGDGKNEIFRAISPATDIEKYSLSVYNRWGARIFQTSQINEGWNGKHKGETAPIGTYFYKCTIKCINKRDIGFLTGDIILIR